MAFDLQMSGSSSSTTRQFSPWGRTPKPHKAICIDLGGQVTEGSSTFFQMGKGVFPMLATHRWMDSKAMSSICPTMLSSLAKVTSSRIPHRTFSACLCCRVSTCCLRMDSTRTRIQFAIPCLTFQSKLPILFLANCLMELTSRGLRRFRLSLMARQSIHQRLNVLRQL